MEGLTMNKAYISRAQPWGTTGAAFLLLHQHSTSWVASSVHGKTLRNVHTDMLSRFTGTEHTYSFQKGKKKKESKKSLNQRRIKVKTCSSIFGIHSKCYDPKDLCRLLLWLIWPLLIV